MVEISKFRVICLNVRSLTFQVSHVFSKPILGISRWTKALTAGAVIFHHLELQLPFKVQNLQPAASDHVKMHQTVTSSLSRDPAEGVQSSAWLNACHVDPLRKITMEDTSEHGCLKSTDPSTWNRRTVMLARFSLTSAQHLTWLSRSDWSQTGPTQDFLSDRPQRVN